jgi:hypothetical protein
VAESVLGRKRGKNRSVNLRTLIDTPSPYDPEKHRANMNQAKRRLNFEAKKLL